jgi:methanethiol S-methyltransferase
MDLKFPRSFAICVGGVSLLLFLVFLFGGALNLVQMGLNNQAILLWDGLISIIFFAQHSIMIRRGFSSWFATVLPRFYHGIVFTITSGSVLAGAMLTWQPSTIALYEFDGVCRLLFRAVFFLGLAGCLWSSYTLRSVRSCDPFGLAATSEDLSVTETGPPQLVVRGPYAYVRHPVYLMVILLIWSCPDVTADRLLFNALWTLWIYIGASLEDRDMRVDFGEAYQEYRKRVPMLVPSPASFLRTEGFQRKS